MYVYGFPIIIIIISFYNFSLMWSVSLKEDSNAWHRLSCMCGSLLIFIILITKILSYFLFKKMFLFHIAVCDNLLNIVGVVFYTVFAYMLSCQLCGRPLTNLIHSVFMLLFWSLLFLLTFFFYFLTTNIFIILKLTIFLLFTFASNIKNI